MCSGTTMPASKRQSCARRLLDIHVREAEAVEEDDGSVGVRDARLAVELRAHA